MIDLRDGSAPGPDEIPSILFRKFAAALAEPVRRIWRICLNEGIMPPNSPILAIVTSIYKGGGKSKPANYRPVSLTNHLTKIFGEGRPEEHMEQNHLFNIMH